MQIEQVVGGVNRDTSAQAIQLRLRLPGEIALEYARIRAWDSAGTHPITLIDFGIGLPLAQVEQLRGLNPREDSAKPVFCQKF